MNRRIAVAFLAVVGVAFVVSPLVLYPHAGQRECVTSLDDRVRGGAEVMQYEDLSADAKRAFDSARSDPEGRASLYGEHCPEEFRYSDAIGSYVVEKDGSRYPLETYSGGGIFPLDLLFAGAFVFVGLAFVTVAGVAATSEDTAASGLVTLGVAGLVALVLAAVDAGASLLAPWTLLLVAVGLVAVGWFLSTRWAIVTGAAVTTALLVGIEWFGFTGSVVVLGVLPPLLVAVGVGLGRLADRGEDDLEDYSS